MNPYYAAILAAFIFFCGLAYERWNLRAELRGVEKLANWYARNLFRDTTAFYESLEKRLDDVEAKMTETPLDELKDEVDCVGVRQDSLHRHCIEFRDRLKAIEKTVHEVRQYAGMIEENANG